MIKIIVFFLFVLSCSQGFCETNDPLEDSFYDEISVTGYLKEIVQLGREANETGVRLSTDMKVIKDQVSRAREDRDFLRREQSIIKGEQRIIRGQQDIDHERQDLLKERQVVLVEKTAWLMEAQGGQLAINREFYAGFKEWSDTKKILAALACIAAGAMGKFIINAITVHFKTKGEKKDG